MNIFGEETVVTIHSYWVSDVKTARNDSSVLSCLVLSCLVLSGVWVYLLTFFAIKFGLAQEGF